MISFSRRLLLAFLIGGAGPVFAQPTREWRQGDPSGEEQLALETLNRIRANPEAAVAHYARLAQGDAVLAATFAGVQTYVYADGFAGVDPAYLSQRPVDSLRGEPAVLALVRSDLAAYSRALGTARRSPPLPPFALYPLFMEQARQRSDAAVSQVSTRGPLFADDRVNFVQLDPSVANAPVISGSNATGGTAATAPGGATATGAFNAGELMALAALPPNRALRDAFIARTAVFATWLDDSYTSRRVGFGGTGFTITPGRTRMVGLHMGAQGVENPGKGSRVLSLFGTDSEAFAVSDLPFGDQTVFVTGVAYRDADRNGEYSVGEGIGGLRVAIDGTDWFTTTSSSGGYAVPVRPESGPVNVRLSGAAGPTAVEVTKEGVVARENIKVDFLVNQVAKPTQVTVPGAEGVSRLANSSTRGIAGRGDRAMSGGFVLRGTLPKRLVVRAVANGLLAFGLKGVLRKPVVVLRRSDGTVVRTVRTQDTYGSGFDSREAGTERYRTTDELAAAFASVGAFSLPAMEHSGRFRGDAAFVADLPPGGYTVTVEPDADTPTYSLNERGLPTTEEDPDPAGDTFGSSGLVLLEIYDASPTTGGIANLSTRGVAGSGDRSLVVGFVLNDSGRSRVILRGIGPALTAFGVAGAIPFTALSLGRADGTVIATNEAWDIAPWSDQSVVLSVAAGAFALAPGSGDSLIVAQLPAGQYGLTLRSGNGIPGIALAEIYLSP